MLSESRGQRVRLVGARERQPPWAPGREAWRELGGGPGEENSIGFSDAQDERRKRRERKIQVFKAEAACRMQPEEGRREGRV